MKSKKMKPLLIFQLSSHMSEEEKRITANAIMDGVTKGALIIDDKVTIISFDEDGNMNYCTPRLEDNRGIRF